MPKKVNFELIGDSHDLHATVRDLVAQHHPHLAEARIALVWRMNWKPDKDGRLTLGKAKKASDLERELGHASEYDLAVLLNAEAWHDLSNDQRLALLDHELCHFGVSTDKKTGEVARDDRGRVVYRYRKHTLEEFHEIVERHGVYKSDIESFADVCARRREGERRGPTLFSEGEGKEAV